MKEARPVGVRSVSDGFDPPGGPGFRGRFTDESRANARIARHRQEAAAGPHPTTRLTPYSDDETEFILAVRAYQEHAGTKFPSFSEVLRVVKQLGYVKVPHGYRLVEIVDEEPSVGHADPVTSVADRPAAPLRLATCE